MKPVLITHSRSIPSNLTSRLAAMPRAVTCPSVPDGILRNSLIEISRPARTRSPTWNSSLIVGSLLDQFGRVDHAGRQTREDVVVQRPTGVVGADDHHGDLLPSEEQRPRVVVRRHEGPNPLDVDLRAGHEGESQHRSALLEG